MSIIDVTRLSYETLPKYGFFEILGKRGTGKTTWTQYLLQHSHTKNNGMFTLIAGSETVQQAWSDLIHPMYIVGLDMAEGHMMRIKNNQNERIRKLSPTEMESTDNHITLILDDVASNKPIMRSKILSYLASNSRHLHMSIYILAQYHCQVVKEIRNQFDTVFVLSTGDANTVRQLHKEYCAGTDLECFKHVLTYMTENYGLLVIDNRMNSTEIVDVCHYDMMTTYPPILDRLGSERQWSFAETNFIAMDELLPSDDHVQTWAKKNHKIIENTKRGKLMIRKF